MSDKKSALISKSLVGRGGSLVVFVGDGAVVTVKLVAAHNRKLSWFMWIVVERGVMWSGRMPMGLRICLRGLWLSIGSKGLEFGSTLFALRI